MSIPDLWPKDIAANANFVMPVAILREQAGLLTQRAKGIVDAQVLSSAKPPTGLFEYHFVLTAPAIDGYHYELLKITYGIEGYPVTVEYRTTEGKKTTQKIKHQQTLMNLLKGIFNLPNTKKVVQALIAQSVS